MSKLKTYCKRAWRYITLGQPIVNITSRIVVLPSSELLKGRTALITGGTSGIGSAIVKAFLEAGANVVLTSRSQKRADEVVEILRLNYPNQIVLGCEMDNANVDSMPMQIDNILSQLHSGKIDILVNNAGLGGGMWGDTDEKEYDAIMDTNLKGAFFLSDIIVKHMQKNHIQGNILNICSSSSIRPANSAYCLSKWGLRGLTEGMAKTLIRDGIVVNGIAPGPTATPMLNSDGVNLMRPNSPIGRLIMPEEIANMAVMLTSDMGRTIVGDVIYMTGGAGTITLDDIAY